MAEIGNVKKVDIEKLIPYVNNAKEHSDSQVTKIAASIREFGFLNPVLIDKDFNIIAGHGRVMAAKNSSGKRSLASLSRGCRRHKGKHTSLPTTD